MDNNSNNLIRAIHYFFSKESNSSKSLTISYFRFTTAFDFGKLANPH